MFALKEAKEKGTVGSVIIFSHACRNNKTNKYKLTYSILNK